MGESIDSWSSEARILEKMGDGWTDRQYGPQGGGTLDLYSYPTVTFLADPDKVLTVAMSGAPLDFVSKLVHLTLGEVSPRLRVG